MIGLGGGRHADGSTGKRSTIRWRLFELIFSVLTPFLIVAGFLAWRYADAERRVIEAERFDQVTNLSFSLDGEVNAVVAVLKVLASAPALRTGDFAAYRPQADAAIGNRIAGLAVLDQTGQQMLSTAVAAGDPLPISANASSFADVFNGNIVVSGIVAGTVTRRPIIFIAVPVYREERIVYALSAVIQPEKFAGLFLRAGINAAWPAAVVDREGKFVARNLLAEKYVGQQSRPELGQAARGNDEIGTFDNTTLEGIVTGNSFRRSSITGWTSVVSVPRDVLLAPFRRTIAWVATVGLALSLAGLAFAAVLATRLAKNIRQFGKAAGTLIEGRPLPEFEPYVSELADVRLAYEHAEEINLARSRDEANIRFLVQELAHRSKNLLTVIQGIATQTGRSARSVTEFVSGFNERLRALAASHDFLFNEEGEAASLERLVKEHIAPFAGEDNRVEVACPGIFLKPHVIQAMGMALHELATNAAKYGALSNPRGAVSVRSEVAADEPGHPLRLSWIESGGPPARTPQRNGFGSVVIDRMIAQAVGGRAEMCYDPDGFKWRLLVSPEYFEALPEGGRPLRRSGGPAQGIVPHRDGVLQGFAAKKRR